MNTGVSKSLYCDYSHVQAGHYLWPFTSRSDNEKPATETFQLVIQNAQPCHLLQRKNRKQEKMITGIYFSISVRVFTHTHTDARTHNPKEEGKDLTVPI